MYTEAAWELYVEMYIVGVRPPCVAASAFVHSSMEVCSLFSVVPVYWADPVESRRFVF